MIHGEYVEDGDASLYEQREQTEQYRNATPPNEERGDKMDVIVYTRKCDAEVRSKRPEWNA